MTQAPQDDGPPDPVTQIAMNANLLHEFHLSFIASGFTEAQSMYLVGKYVGALVFRA